MADTAISADGASFTVALHAVRDQIIHAAAVIAETTIDLIGTIGQVRYVVVAEGQANQKPDSRAVGAKIVLVSLAVAVVAAAIVITVVLLQADNSGPTTAPAGPAGPTTVTSGVSTKKVLDKSALDGDNGIRKILIETYRVPADQIHRVNCPAGQEVEAGNTFTCTVQIGDDTTREKLVDVKVIDDNGEYVVGSPRDK